MTSAKLSEIDFTTLGVLQKGIWVADASGRLVFVNDAMARIAGVKASTLTGQNLLSLPEETLKDFLGFFNHARQTLLPCEYECPVVTTAGHTIWQGGWLTPLLDDGRYDGMICSAVDMTERKRIQEALELSEARYRAIVQDQAEAISRVLPDGRFTFVNEAFCRLFGTTPDQLIGQCWHPVAHPDDVAMIVGKLAELSPNKALVTMEARNYLADGELHWMQWVSRGIFDAEGQLKEIQSVGRDISDLKRTEIALRESEERLEMALAASGLGCWDTDLTTGRVVADQRVSEILGYSIEQLSQRSFWRGLHDPRDVARFDRDLNAHLQGDSPLFFNEHHLRHNDGHWVTVQARGKVIERDNHGHPLRIVGTLLDVSQSNRLNEEGIELLARIESLIRETSSKSPPGRTQSKALESLTKRERQILVMIGEGMTSAQIGEQLHLATNTIISHRKNLMSKLDLHTTAEVMRCAMVHGLLHLKPGQ